MYLACGFWILQTRNLAYPVVPSGKECKDCAHTQHIMEMCYHVIGVM